MKNKIKIGLIGGSGLSESKVTEKAIFVNTPYGQPSSPYEKEKFNSVEILFLRRHGENHSIPPHKINYRANIYGFKNLGVERILGIFAVGSLNKKIPPGSIVIPDQIIDFTQGTRESTFYEGPKVIHIDFTEPFCNEIRQSIFKAAESIDIEVIPSATYICVNGPRLETAAEIKFFREIGADIIGMTLMPEASLARELELCYAAVAIVGNYAAGISEKPLTVKEVVESVNQTIMTVKKLLIETFKIIPKKRDCFCRDALKNASF